MAVSLHLKVCFAALIRNSRDPLVTPPKCRGVRHVYYEGFGPGSKGPCVDKHDLFYNQSLPRQDPGGSKLTELPLGFMNEADYNG
jgi:hypothetical protein